MKRMSTEAKLGLDKFVVDEGNPHIRVDDSKLDAATVRTLIAACPASLFRLDGDGRLMFDCAGCLECGTCRVLCGSNTEAMQWNYPRPTFGVFYRYG